MKKRKEEIDYFDQFIKGFDCAETIAIILKNFMNNFDDSKTEEIFNEVHEYEQKADKILHITLDYLVRDFLPPIDRDDIIRLTHRIDNVVDNLDEVVINLDIFDVKTIREDVIEIAQLIETTCKKTKSMLKDFKDFTKYEDIILDVARINKHENNGDLLYRKAIKNLYKNEKDVLEIVKWTKVYEGFENILDSCEDVANCVQEIATKNA